MLAVNPGDKMAEQQKFCLLQNTKDLAQCLACKCC